MHLIILAAGFATRMYPLTRDRAKPLLEVAGKTILDRVLTSFAGHALQGVTIVVNGRFLAEFEAWLPAARARHHAWPLELLSDGVQEPTMHLGALRDLHLALSRAPQGDFIVSGGDNLFLFAMTPMFERFQQTGHVVLPVRRVTGPLVPGTYAEVQWDTRGRVTMLREKPPDPVSPYAGFCLYWFPAAARQWLAEYLAQGGNGDAPGYFLAWLQPRVPIEAVEIAGQWYDIGSLQSYAQACAALDSDRHATGS